MAQKAEKIRRIPGWGRPTASCPKPSPPRETAAKHASEVRAVDFAGPLDGGVQQPRHIKEQKPHPFHRMTPAVGADPIANLQGSGSGSGSG